MSAIKEFKQNNSINGISENEVQFADNGRWVKIGSLSTDRERYYDSLYWALYEELGYPKRKKNIAFISKRNDNSLQVVHSKYNNKVVILFKKIKQNIMNFKDTYSD